MESEDGETINQEPQAPFRWTDPCVERGVTVAFNEEANAKARKDGTEFFSTVLRTK
jgi:hypothetical protein